MKENRKILVTILLLALVTFLVVPTSVYAQNMTPTVTVTSPMQNEDYDDDDMMQNEIDNEDNEDDEKESFFERIRKRFRIGQDQDNEDNIKERLKEKEEEMREKEEEMREKLEEKMEEMEEYDEEEKLGLRLALGEKIRTQCEGLQGEEFRQCVKEIIDEGLKIIVANIKKRITRLKEIINQNRFLDENTKAQLIARLEDLEARLDNLQSFEDIEEVRDDLEDIRELVKKVTEEVHEKVLNRVERRLERAVAVLERVFSKVSNNMTADQQAQASQHLELAKQALENFDNATTPEDRRQYAKAVIEHVKAAVSIIKEALQ